MNVGDKVMIVKLRCRGVITSISPKGTWFFVRHLSGSGRTIRCYRETEIKAHAKA